MKSKLALALVILTLISVRTSAQKFTFGIENGINYSNIWKSFDNDRFQSQSGAVNGIFAKYQLGNWFLVQSGLNHATINFEETQRYYSNYWMNSSSSYYPNPHLSSCVMPPSHSYNTTNHYSFLRVPLLIKFRTPGKINFEIGGGYYYAFMTNDAFRGKDKDRFDEEYRDENFPDMTDWGWILASSVNFNINNKWSIFANGQVTYGREEYFESVEGKMGSTELTFGIGYKPFSKQANYIPRDSLGNRIQIVPHSGFNISNVKSDKDDGEYGSTVGFSAGVSLKFDIGGDASVVTGAWYDRKGYKLDYNGRYPALYYVEYNSAQEAQIKSEVHLDYLTIPFLFDLSFGKKVRSNIEFGTYFSLLQNAFAEGEQINSHQNETSYVVNKRYFNESLDIWFRNTDIGFMIAYRIEYPVFKWANIFASINQSWGITNILENSDEAKDAYHFISQQDLKNRSTAVHFGLTIPVNKN